MGIINSIMAPVNNLLSKSKENRSKTKESIRVRRGKQWFEVSETGKMTPIVKEAKERPAPPKTRPERPKHSCSRRAYRKAGGHWIEISYDHIRAGDLIMLREPDGEVVGTFEALSDAYPGKFGFYQFDCDAPGLRNKMEE